MTTLEQQVWAAAYAAEFAYQRELWRKTSGASAPDGYACAMTADKAVKRLREAFAEDSADFLPLTEPSP